VRYAFFACFFISAISAFIVFISSASFSSHSSLVLAYAFSVDSRREPPFVEVVVYHRHASRATLAYLALVGLKFLLRRGFRGGGFTCLGWFHALREFGHFCVCTANLSVDTNCRLLLHGVGNVTVYVERCLVADVAYHSGESFDIHAVFKRHGSEGMAQVVEADLLALRSLQYLLEFAVDLVGISRLTFLDGRWEHPLAGSIFLMHRKDIQHIGWQNERSYRGFGLWLGDLSLRPLLDHLPSDVELACSEVDVLPLKTEYLPSAHTRSQLEKEELIVSFLVCLH